MLHSGCQSRSRVEGGMSSPSRSPPPSSPRRVKASRYGLSHRTRTTDVQAVSSVITRLIGRRRDETAASVLSTAARDGRNARSWRERKRERAFLIYSYRRAIRCRRCQPRLQPEYSGVCEGGDRGRKKEEYTLYREARI